MLSLTIGFLAVLRRLDGNGADRAMPGAKRVDIGAADYIALQY
jgi:hypothetical protein